MYFPPSPRAASPVTLQQAKMHLRAGGCYDAASADAYTAEDAMIGAYLAAASQLVEDVLGRALLTQTWTATFAAPSPAGAFCIDRGPFVSLTSVEALVTGAYTTVSTSIYKVRRLSNDETVVRLAEGQSWPIADEDDAAFKLTFVMGYGAASDVPAAIIAAILLGVGELYDNREATIAANLVENPAIASLLRPYMAPSY